MKRRIVRSQKPRSGHEGGIGEVFVLKHSPPGIRVRVGPDGPSQEILDRAILELFAGGIVVYPTETLYGLGVDAQDAKAVEKLFALKGRESGKPIPVLVPSRESLDRWVRKVTPLARRLIEAFWPGPLTLLLHARKGLPESVLGKDGSLGVRETSVRWVQDWVRAANTPVTATSVNRSGHPPAVSGEQALRAFPTGADLIFDAGKCPLGKPSTVVDARGARPVILREGAVSRKAILAAA